MRPLTFLYEIESWTTFIWSLFWYNVYFWQSRAPKWICFPISIHYYISKTAIFIAPSSSTPVEDRHMRPVTFLYEIESWTNFIWRFFFNIMGIFGSVVPQSESTFLFLYIIIFQKWQSLQSPSSTFVGGRRMRGYFFVWN